MGKLNVDNTQEHTCLSLCSGYGGLELGLKRACPNVRTIAYVEVEAFACANLVSKMEQGFLDAAPIWTNIKTFNAEPFRDRVHIITAGYPCQPFSVAGQRQGTDDPRHLWPYIERIISTVRPVWFFGENVAGHLTIGFPEVYRSLRVMGYKVEAGLFGTMELGFLHNRERLFILAYSNGNNGEFIKELSVEKREICNHQKRNEPPIWSKFDKCFRNKSTRGFSVKPLLDRRIDGTTRRVDRLRLLGNGVVPQQAEKAFRTLRQFFS